MKRLFLFIFISGLLISQVSGQNSKFEPDYKTQAVAPFHGTLYFATNMIIFGGSTIDYTDMLKFKGDNSTTFTETTTSPSDIKFICPNAELGVNYGFPIIKATNRPILAINLKGKLLFEYKRYGFGDVYSKDGQSGDINDFKLTRRNLNLSLGGEIILFNMFCAGYTLFIPGINYLQSDLWDINTLKYEVRGSSFAPEFAFQIMPKINNDRNLFRISYTNPIFDAEDGNPKTDYLKIQFTWLKMGDNRRNKSWIRLLGYKAWYTRYKLSEMPDNAVFAIDNSGYYIGFVFGIDY